MKGISARCEVLDILHIDEVLNLSMRLCTPPALYFQLLDLACSETASIEEIADLVSRDPAVTAKLLKLANSAHYSYSRKVETVEQAINVMGVEQLINVVLAISVATSFSGIPPYMIDMDTFWVRSVLVSSLCVLLAKRVSLTTHNRMLTIGILHDLGTLILSQCYEDLKDLARRKSGDDSLVEPFEEAYSGYKHGVLTAEVLTSWRIPEHITETIRFQHQPLDAHDCPVQTKVLYLAQQLVDTVEKSTYRYEPDWKTDMTASVCESLCLGNCDDELLLMLDEAEKELDVLLSCLMSST